MWNQNYDPFGNVVISTAAAALPTVLLLAMIASGRVKIHIAAVVAWMAGLSPLFVEPILEIFTAGW